MTDKRPPHDEPKITLDADTVMWIATFPDAEVRNHLVTLAYWEMSRHLDKVLHYAVETAEDLDAHRHGRVAKGREPNANWFTVATWAISTIGRNIRSGELPRRLDRVLPSGLRRQAEPWVLSMRSSGGRQVARALGDGQVVVFVSTMLHALKFLQNFGLDETAALQTRYSKDPEAFAYCTIRIESYMPDVVGGDPSPRPRWRDLALADRGEVTKLDAPKRESLFAARLTEPLPATDRDLTDKLRKLFEFPLLDLKSIERLRKLQPNDRRMELEKVRIYADDNAMTGVLEVLAEAFGAETEAHLRDLDAAFEAYGRAARSENPTVVAAEIFRGNLIISAVEQVLLDGAVTKVVNHVPQELEGWVEGRSSVFLERSLRVPRALGRLGVSRRMRRTQQFLQATWVRLLTDQLLVVALPTETLRIGRDIPPRSWRDDFFPAALEALPKNPPNARASNSAADVLSTDALFDLFDRSHGDGRGTAARDWRRYAERMNFAVSLLRSRQQDPTLFWQPYNDEDCIRIASGCVPMRTADPYEHRVVTPSIEPFGGGP